MNHGVNIISGTLAEVTGQIFPFYRFPTLSYFPLVALDVLENNKSLSKRLKAVRKALAYLEHNPKHPSLSTHKYHSLKGPLDEEVFEAYAENNTPAAYRIFWYYGPKKQEITIIAITEHP